MPDNKKELLDEFLEKFSNLYPIGTRMEQEFFLQRMKKVPMDSYRSISTVFGRSAMKPTPKVHGKNTKPRLIMCRNDMAAR